jgi:hypothetical protein
MGCCHVVDPPDRRFPDFVTSCAPDRSASSNWGSSASSAYTSFAFTQRLIAAGVDPSVGSVGVHRRPSHGRPAFLDLDMGCPSAQALSSLEAGENQPVQRTRPRLPV